MDYKLYNFSEEGIKNCRVTRNNTTFPMQMLDLENSKGFITLSFFHSISTKPIMKLE